MRVFTGVLQQVAGERCLPRERLFTHGALVQPRMRFVQMLLQSSRINE